jgi:hypothetical protein
LQEGANWATLLQGLFGLLIYKLNMTLVLFTNVKSYQVIGFAEKPV